MEATTAVSTNITLGIMRDGVGQQRSSRETPVGSISCIPFTEMSPNVEISVCRYLIPGCWLHMVKALMLITSCSQSRMRGMNKEYNFPSLFVKKTSFFMYDAQGRSFSLSESIKYLSGTQMCGTPLSSDIHRHLKRGYFCIMFCFFSFIVKHACTVT